MNLSLVGGSQAILLTDDVGGVVRNGLIIGAEISEILSKDGERGNSSSDSGVV